MKCPKCGDPFFKYLERRIKKGSTKNHEELLIPRSNFEAKCKKCGNQESH